MKSSDTTLETSQENPLGYEKESMLLVGFAIPCIISMLVTAFTTLSTRFLSDRVSECSEMRQPILPFRFRPPARRFPFYSESAVPPTFHSTSVPVKKTNPQNTQEMACALWQFSESAFSF